MEDREKIQAAINMLRRLKTMVGFFMKQEISDLISRLEEPLSRKEPDQPLSDVDKIIPSEWVY